MSHEEREDSELGELSEGLFYEHEGRFPDPVEAPMFESGHQIPPDIGYQGGVEAELLERGEIGSTKQGTRVESVFDARPINGRDFLTNFREPFEVEANGLGVVIPAVFTFTVPQGYIGILRSFRYSVEALPASTDIGILLAVDNVFVPNFSGIDNLGANVENQPCYVIADAGQTFQLTITTTPAGVVFSTFATASLYGNLLLKRGYPTQFEPGSSPSGF